MRQKILVVEDGEFNRDLMLQLLGDDYAVVLATDGHEALRKAEQERPDLILMDLGLPGLDGWEATRRIKRDPTFKGIPIIAVTSHAMVGDESKARQAGCDEYLAKPIDADELMRAIRRLL